MNIQYLQQLLSGIREIKILGKSAEINGVICHVLGIVRCECRLRLVVLQYDENFVRRVEEAELAEFNEMMETVQNNRQRLRGGSNIELANQFEAVSKVKIGNASFDVEVTGYRRCSSQDWEVLTMLTEFIRLGWQPESIDYQDIDSLFLTTIELAGKFTLIPDLGENPVLQFELHSKSVPFLVEQPFTLAVGAEYPDTMWFHDRTTGEEHWMRINRVYLYDIWTEVLNSFNDPQLKEQLSPEELEKARDDFEHQFSTICPKGMYFPVVEYECEEGITLQFYDRAWLDAEPVYSSSDMGFIIAPDAPTGVLGLPLKAALIQQPVSEDTKSIDVELFWYHKLEEYADLVL